MQIGILGETDWFTIKIDRSIVVEPSLDEVERQHQLRTIGAALDNEQLDAILNDPARLEAFRNLVVRYVSWFLGFRLAKRRGLNYMIAFFRARHGSYHSRTICLTNADIDHTTLVGGVVESLHLFRKDGDIYHDSSIIVGMLRDMPQHVIR